MNAVIYFSCTGHGKAVAENLAKRLNFSLAALTRQTENDILSKSYSTAVVVFPVHCQSYPKFMKKFFARLNAEKTALVAVYGRANAGNAVYEAAKLIRCDIVAAAYIPVGHSYLKDGYVPDGLPQELIDKIAFNPSPVKIPKRRKTPFAGSAPALRSRILLKIKRTEKCDDCNLCNEVCHMCAIKHGKTNGRCVRCLACVAACPQKALKIKKARVLTRYLEKTKCFQIIMYLS